MMIQLKMNKIRCNFYLQPYEGTTEQTFTQGRLSAPRILRIHKVINYVIEKMVLDKPLENDSEGAFVSVMTGQSTLPSMGDGSFRSSLKPWQKLKPSCVEILCNNQVLNLEMSLATVKAFIWKKPEDLILHYKVVQR